MTLSTMPLSQLLETCRSFATQTQAHNTDRLTAVQTLLILNDELVRRTAHAEAIIREMATALDEFESSETRDQRVASAVRMLNEGRY